MLHEAVRAIGKAFFLFPFGVEEDQVAGDIFYFRLGAFLHLLPRSRAELAQFGWFSAVLAFVLGQLMEGMDADEYDIVVLIDQLDGFLHLAVHFRADQSAELSDTVVDMHDVVAGRELVQLL